jgi:hypothetical protein
MSSSHRYSRFFALIAFFFCLSAPGQQRFSIKFKVDNSLIIVPVTINGAGPYNFLLDTGCSDMAVDSKLVAELKLPNAGDAKILAPHGTGISSVVRINSVLIGGATVQHVNASVARQFEGPFYNVRGLLGEAFLQNFDLLIDNQRHVVEFESGPGLFADSLTGERTPVLLHGDYQGRFTKQRIVLFAHIRDLGERDLRLLLDSGADRVVLFDKVGGLITKQQYYFLLGTPNSGDVSAVNETTVHSLRVGGRVLTDVTVTIPSVIPESDVDGLLPTYLFHSVFICHSGEFVILNPTVKPQIAPLKPQVAATN